MPSQVIHRKQRGAALMVMLVILVVGALTFLVNNLNNSADVLKIARNKSSAIALVQAKAALVSRAIANQDNPGSLPCPDTDDNGDEEPLAGAGNDCPSYIGRLPWRTLGIPDLRDGNGERLWYALSRNFRDAAANPINSDTAGTLALSGTIIENGLAAIIFSPSSNVSGQTRSTTAMINCVSLSGNSVSESNCPTNYLEPGDNVAQANATSSNSTLSTAASPHEKYLSGAPSPTFNDHMITVSPDDIFIPVEMRIAREAKKCLDEYATASADKYSWAAPVAATNIGQVATLFGRIPDTPNIDIPGGADPDYNAINTALIDLSVSMTACETADTPANIAALAAAAASLSSATSALPDPPYTPAFVSNANSLISLAASGNACDDIKDDREPFLTNINASFSTTQSTLGSLITSTDPEMDPAWPAGCFISGSYWDNWKSLIFYQIDAQYSPSNTPLPSPVPTADIKINGSGNYRAVVITSRSIVPGGAARVVANEATYLEQALPTTDFVTNSPSNLPAYSNTNDLVLCIDGNLNCQ